MSVVVSSPFRPVPTHPHPPPFVARSTYVTHPSSINPTPTPRVDVIHDRDVPRQRRPLRS